MERGDVDKVDSFSLIFIFIGVQLIGIISVGVSYSCTLLILFHV